MYDNNMGGLNRSPGHIDLNAITWDNPYQVKISPNPGCLIVHTTCAIHKLDPDKKRVYFVSVRDGQREACFITNGSERITAENFASGINANGHRFFSHKQDLREVYAQDIRKNAKIFKDERADMVGFILDCLEIPAIFAPEGSKTYTV